MAVGVLGCVLGTRRGCVCKRVDACVREHVRDCDSVSVYNYSASVRQVPPWLQGTEADTTMNTNTFPPHKQAQMNTLSTRLSLFESVEALKEVKTEACSKSKGPQEARQAGGLRLGVWWAGEGQGGLRQTQERLVSWTTAACQC